MDLEKAQQLLKQGDYTCVLCRGDRVITSHLRGVAPLVELIDSGTAVSGFYAADKVVGKATALLYCYLRVCGVYAHVISRPAVEVLRDHGITVCFRQLVDYIQNRSGDGCCPMETATLNMDDPVEALQAVRKTLRRLQEEKKS